MKYLLIIFSVGALAFTGCAGMKSIPMRVYHEAFTLDQPALTTARVLDGKGAEVLTLWSNRGLSAGPITIDWDGRDAKGENLAPGAYTLVLSLSQWQLKAIDSFGGLGSTPGRFLDPRGLCAYPQGARLTVAVADTGNSRIQILTDTGGFLQAAGDFGGGDQKLDQPTDVDWDGQILTVCDSQNHRLVRFDERGNYLGEILQLTGLQGAPNRPLNANLVDPRCIGKAGGGAAFWVSDQGRGILFNLTSTGGVLQELGDPFPLGNEGPFFQLMGEFFIQVGRDKVQILDSNGNTTGEAKPVPPFQQIGGMVSTSLGFGIVSDSQSGLLYFLDKDGKTFETFTPEGAGHPGAMSLWEDHFFIIDTEQNTVFRYQLIPIGPSDLKKQVVVAGMEIPSGQ